MFAKRVVTQAVKKNCLFCDACMKMIEDDEDYVIQQFAVMQGKHYANRTCESKEQYVVCRRCFESMTGSYQIHKDMIEAGSEKVFQKEGITEAEIRALLSMKPEKKTEMTTTSARESFVKKIGRKEFLQRRI